MSSVAAALARAESPELDVLVVHCARASSDACAACSMALMQVDGVRLRRVVGIEAALDELARSSRPDCVVLGLGDRCDHGLAQVDLLVQRFPDCPLVVQVGALAEAVGLEALHRGAHDFLVGAATSTSLRRAVRHAMVQAAQSAQLKQLARLHAVVAQANQLITRASDVEDLLAGCCEIAVSAGGYRMAWVGATRPGTDRVGVLARCGDSGGYLDDIFISLAPEAPRGPTALALLGTEPIVCEDIADDPRMLRWRGRALAEGFRSSAAFPIHRHGAPFAVLSVYSEVPAAFGPEEMALLEGLAGDLTYAIAALDAGHAQQEAERERGVLEQRFRGLVQDSDELILVVEHRGISYASPAAARLLGTPVEALVGRTVESLLDERDQQAAADWVAVLRTIRADEAGPRLDARIRDADGRQRLFELSGKDLSDDPAVAGVVVHAREVTESRRAQLGLDVYSHILEMTVSGEPLADVLDALAADIQLLVPSAGICLTGSADEQCVVRAAAGLGEEVDHLVLPAVCEDPATLVDGPVVTTIEPGATPELWELCRRHGFDAVRRYAVRVPAAASYDSPLGGPGSGAVLVLFDSALETVAGVDHAGALAARAYSIALAREDQMQLLTHQALHDGLTGLPNRVLAIDRLRERVDAGEEVGVIQVALDRFKQVNAGHGQRGGDLVLREVARRLRRPLRHTDLLARLGADEFMVLLSPMEHPGEALAIARALRAALEAPVEIDGKGVVVRASIGISVSRGLQGQPGDRHDLLRDAANATYRAKLRGGDCIEVSDPQMSATAARRLALEDALREAVPAGGIDVHYQPEIDLRTGRVVGCEALARFTFEGRPCAPTEFIGVAEESNLIDDLGQVVLRLALRQLHRWRRDGHDLFMAVNLSARQLADPLLAGTLMTAVEQEQVPAAAVCLEVTESGLMRDTAASARLVQTLREHGFPVALDDFGTGYSSLAHLKAFPFDYLKVDRSFVSGIGRDRGDTAIVDAIVSVAQALGASTTAEGVETDAQRELLTAAGCDLGQGFLWSRAVPAPEFEARLLSVDPEERLGSAS